MASSWAFKRPEIPKISKISLKMGNVRIYLPITNKILMF
jgi:hypothetical protein